MVKSDMSTSPVTQRLIGITDLACQIADDKARAMGLTRSEYIEWVILCQQFSAGEAEALWKLRRQRGGRGGVHVVAGEG
jgi:hypothetical protein